MTRTMTTIIATGTTYAAATGTTVTVNITGTNVADAALPSTLIFAAATPTAETISAACSCYYPNFLSQP